MDLSLGGCCGGGTRTEGRRNRDQALRSPGNASASRRGSSLKIAQRRLRDAFPSLLLPTVADVSYRRLLDLLNSFRRSNKNKDAQPPAWVS